MPWQPWKSMTADHFERYSTIGVASILAQLSLRKIFEVQIEAHFLHFVQTKRARMLILSPFGCKGAQLSVVTS